MLRSLYNWTLSLAARKSAEAWLAVIAFIESSFFLVPADVLFLPMVLARKDRAYRYALVATVASVVQATATTTSRQTPAPGRRATARVVRAFFHRAHTQIHP